MHELAIVESVIGLCAERCGGARVARVVLEIGKLSCVMPDAVRFCFDLATEGTALEGAALEIREIPGRARCNACGVGLQLDRAFGRCGCGCTELEWLSGEELRVKELELA